MAVEEALGELLASDTHYRRELNDHISSKITVAEGKRRAKTQELKEVSYVYKVRTSETPIKSFRISTLNFSGKIEEQLRGAGAAPDTVVPAAEGGEGTPPKCPPRD